MKYLKLTLISLIAATFAFTACGGGGGGETGPHAGDTKTYTADDVSFVMVYVPGGLTSPTGVKDDGTATVANAYWIGETEVTFELWYKVRTWALLKGYTFQNNGLEGNSGTPGDPPTGNKDHPVTKMNWRDCIVWCNALTEWYNEQNGTSYECVYTHSGEILRDSRGEDNDVTPCDEAVVSSTAKGFRLLTSDEWELAARYRKGNQWTYGDHVSGDDSGVTATYNQATTPLAV